MFSLHTKTKRQQETLLRQSRKTGANGDSKLKVEFSVSLNKLTSLVTVNECNVNLTVQMNKLHGTNS